MKNSVYFNGRGVYRRCGDFTTPFVKKSDFLTLLKGVEEFDMYIPNNIATKYVRQCLRKGWIVTSTDDYGWGDLKIHFKPYRSVVPRPLCFFPDDND